MPNLPYSAICLLSSKTETNGNYYTEFGRDDGLELEECQFAHRNDPKISRAANILKRFVKLIIAMVCFYVGVVEGMWSLPFKGLIWQ